MKIRTKILLIIVVLTASIFLVLHALTNLILIGSFVELEEQETKRNVSQALSALSNEVDQLATQVGDWASWDDTYAFIQDRNEDYIESNLVDSTFLSLRLNIMLFVNSTGSIVYGSAFDLENETRIAVPQSIEEQITGSNLLWSHPNTDSRLQGTILLPEGPMLFASQPILTSMGEGPINGALIMGRYLDSAEIEYVSQTIHHPVSLCLYNDSQASPDFQMARTLLSEAQPIAVQALNADVVGGYALIEDPYANPILMLRIDSPRDIYNQGVATTSYFTFSLLAVSLILGSTTMFLLSLGVLKPLSRLTSSVKEMGKNRDQTISQSRAGDDEISVLAGAIKDTMSERLRAIEELAAMVGHDLRNPLTGIAGATYYLKTKYGSKVDNKGGEMLNIIEKNIEYSNKIVNDLLDYSRPIRLELMKVGPDALISEVLSLAQIPENIKVVDLTEKEPRLRIDSDKMKRAFTNIVRNAVEAMPEGGTLTVSSRLSNGKVVFEFSDTGVGMPKEVLEKLWSPLFTTKAKGMGFGLAICRRIVEAHEGQVVVRSAVGEGSTFRIVLPAKAENADGSFGQ